MTEQDFFDMADNLNALQQTEIQDYLDTTTDGPGDVAKWIWRKIKEYLESQ